MYTFLFNDTCEVVNNQMIRLTFKNLCPSIRVYKMNALNIYFFY